MNKKALGKKLKGIISIILVLSMVTTLTIPSMAYAAEKEKDENTNVEILVGETTQLKVSKNNVTWKSSDESIATVSKKGKVTGIKPGNVVITAKTKSPGLNKQNKGTTTTFNVIVKSKDETNDETKDKAKVKISLNTDSFKCCKGETETWYEVSNLVNEFQGTIEGVNKVKSLSYSILDKNNNSIKSDSIKLAENWTVSGIGLNVGYNVVTLTAKLKDGSEISEKYVLLNTNEDNVTALGIDVTKDSDKDEIPDYYESQLGLDPSTNDSDKDGLPDDYELFSKYVSPSESDTDSNGTKDSDEDSDSDGLTNLQEYKLGTSFENEDTDGDGLADGEEVNKYKTNPTKDDTDDDGVDDGTEVKLGTNPLEANKTFDFNFKAEVAENALVTPSVDMSNLTADQVNNINICEVKSGMLADSNIPGYIDSAYGFNEIGEFGKAVLSFEIDKSLFSDPDFKPAIYWFDEENQFLAKLENQVIKGNTVSAEISHFSKYIVLDSSKYDTVWKYKIKYDEDGSNTYKGIDVVFTLDCSGSMSTTDNSVAKQVTKKFVDNLTPNDRAAVVGFESSAHVYSDFTNDAKSLYAAIDKIYNSGGTNLSKAISESLNLFQKESYKNDGRMKCIIMLTDGDGEYNSSYTTQAKDNNIIIYTVGLGSYVKESLLRGIAETTGGAYYQADKASELTSIFNTIAQESDRYKDSDGDGLSDYFEKEMMNGNLRLGTGVQLTGVNYLVADSDNDGLNDGDEIEVKDYTIPFISSLFGRPPVYVKMYSNPTVRDTDEDGIEDKQDDYPLVYGKYDDVEIYQSKYLEGIDPNDKDKKELAPDLKYGDESLSDIESHGDNFKIEAKAPEALIWADMRLLFKLGISAAPSDIKDVTKEMLNHFDDGTGTIYSDERLTNYVRNDDRMNTTITTATNLIKSELESNGADLKALRYDPYFPGVNFTHKYYDKVPAAYFDRRVDIVNGLGILIHGFQGFKVTICDFKKTDTNYTGTIVFHYYDHFGLDSDEGKYNKIGGFVNWYLLQHYDKFNKKYAPFITHFDIEVPISGTY